MNRARIREDVLAHRAQLPKQFSNAEYYVRQTGCYCIYGWLSVVTGGPDPKDFHIGQYAPVSDYLQARYNIAMANDHLYEADRIVCATGHPHPVSCAHVAPADRAIEAFLSSLEGPPRA